MTLATIWSWFSPFIFEQPAIVFGEDAKHHTRDGSSVRHRRCWS
jgi:hypothetical protein